MYGKKIESLLKSLNAELGDTIRLSSGKVRIEGEIMPSTEANDPDILILKLNSGYNVGINPESYKTEKLDRKRVLVKHHELKMKSNPELEDVSLIYTGGTIGSRLDYKTGAVHPPTKVEDILYEVPEVAEIANLSVVPLMSIMSEDMTFREWAKMAGSIAKELNGGARGVIVAHGTDIMHYTSAALSFMLKGLNAPVVVTGAQRSSDRGSSDAFMNLLCSANVAARSDIAEVGICMHYTSSDTECSFVRGTKVRKMHTSRRDTFRAINDRPIALIKHTGAIEYKSAYRKIDRESSAKLKPLDKFDPKVALVKVFPNSDPDVVDFYVGKGYSGIILEGTGLGHAPIAPAEKDKSWLPHVKGAIDKGVIVGMTSQCIYGRVHPNVYRNLRLMSSAGVVYCEDMTPETSLVKLGWLLGNYGKDEARRMLSKNIVGEIRSRTEYDSFLV